MGLEADVTPQMKRPELVSSQAQSLTKKYQETKELLKLQELKKRNMQAQLGLSLSHITEPYFSEPPESSILESPPNEPVEKTVSFFLQDSTEAIQEIEDLITGKPLTLKELAKLLRSHSCNREIAEKHHLQKLLETWKYHQEIENEALKKSLARAGESIREYEARLLTMEDMVEKVQKKNFESCKSPYGPLSEIENHSEANDMTTGMLYQRVELLTSENGALKQRCQEIVNQLTEADREIDRLKAELSSQQGSKQHHLVMDELKRLKDELAENKANAIDREYYERELNEKSLRLHEALVTLEELGNTLKDTEKKLQLKEATLKGLGFQADYEDEHLHPEDERLKELLEASQTRFSELEAKLQYTEQCCLEFEARNSELITLRQECERVSGEKLGEAENKIRMLQEKLEMKTVNEYFVGGEKPVDNKGLIKQVVDGMAMKCEAIDQVLAMLTIVDANASKMINDLKKHLFGSSNKELLFISQNDMRLVIEGEFWSQLLGTFETTSEGDKYSFERGFAEQMMAQTRLMLLVRSSCPQAEIESKVATESDFETTYKWLDNETNALILKELTNILEAKSNVLKQIASSVDLASDDKLLALVLVSFDIGQEQKHFTAYLFDALKEACASYVITRLQGQHEKQLKQENGQIGSTDCQNCPKLRDSTRDLESKPTYLQSQLSEISLNSSTGPQTSVQVEGEPIVSLEKSIELQDMIARHSKELQQVKDGYEQEAEKLRYEITETNETLHVRAEENAKEIDSLTNCIENLKKMHELEREHLIERFDQEMEELRGMISPTYPKENSTEEDREPQHSLAHTFTLKERIQELLTQVSVMTQEMKRREEQGDITTLQLKYEKDLENLKVEVLLVLALVHL